MKKIAGYLIIYIVIVFVVAAIYMSNGLGIYESFVYSYLITILVTVVFFILRFALWLIESPL